MDHKMPKRSLRSWKHWRFHFNIFLWSWKDWKSESPNILLIAGNITQTQSQIFTPYYSGPEVMRIPAMSASPRPRNPQLRCRHTSKSLVASISLQLCCPSDSKARFHVSDGLRCWKRSGCRNPDPPGGCIPHTLARVFRDGRDPASCAFTVIIFTNPPRRHFLNSTP